MIRRTHHESYVEGPETRDGEKDRAHLPGSLDLSVLQYATTIR